MLKRTRSIEGVRTQSQGWELNVFFAKKAFYVDRTLRVRDHKFGQVRKEPGESHKQEENPHKTLKSTSEGQSDKTMGRSVHSKQARTLNYSREGIVRVRVIYVRRHGELLKE